MIATRRWMLGLVALAAVAALARPAALTAQVPPDTAVAAAQGPDTGAADMGDAESSDTFGPALAGAPVVAATLRGAGDGALMAGVGLLALLAWVLPTGGGAPGRAAVRALWVAAVALLLHLAAWVLGASFDHTFGADAVPLLTATDAGRIELVRVCLVVATAIVALRRPAGAAVLGLLALAASAAVGHAAAEATTWSLPAKILHLWAGAAWLGGLLFLLLADRSTPEYPGAVERVSAVALASVLVVTASGVAAALLFLPHPADAFHTAYGALAFAKLGGVGILVLFGAYNRYVLVPRAREGAAVSRLGRSVAWEVGIMTAVILLGGLLAYVPPSPDAG